jgi:hypothetical protein
MQQLSLRYDLFARLEERLREGLLEILVFDFLFLAIFLISLQQILSGAKSCIGSIKKLSTSRARLGAEHPVHSP